MQCAVISMTPSFQVVPRFIYDCYLQEQSGSVTVLKLVEISVCTLVMISLLWLPVSLNFVLYSESHVWGLRRGDVEDASQHPWLGLSPRKAKEESSSQVCQSSVGMGPGPKFIAVKSSSLSVSWFCTFIWYWAQGEDPGNLSFHQHCSLPSVTAILTAQEIHAFCLALGEGSTSSLCQSFLFKSWPLCFLF